ncbi:MAG: gamma subclass chorismate mutase AroQ [Arsenophonus sp. ET-DL9-MAG3]
MFLITIFFILFTIKRNQYKKIIFLIEKRLSYMKYIAKYKIEKKIPIDDRIQENKVILNSLNKAETLGLDEKSIKIFIMSQINLAKIIQYRYKLNQLSTIKTITQYHDLEDIRLKLNKLSNEIIELIANELKNNGKIKNKIYLYINKIHINNIEDTDKKIIYLSLKQISLRR